MHYRDLSLFEIYNTINKFIYSSFFKDNAPPSKDILLKADNPAWKEFSMKPSIKFVLKALGMVHSKILFLHVYIAVHSLKILNVIQECLPRQYSGRGPKSDKTTKKELKHVRIIFLIQNLC